MTALEGSALVHPPRAGARRVKLHRAPERRIGVLATSRAETACFGRHDAHAARLASGGSALCARHAARRLLEQGVDGLVSFGLAAGLAPALRPGDLVLASHVVLPSGAALPTDASWREALLHALAGVAHTATVARIAGGDRLDLSVSAKRRLFMSTFAAAIDTESAAVAEAAQAAGVPFLVLRAITDPAEVARPTAALAALRADGSARPLAPAAALAMRPWEIAASWRHARIERKALRVLRQVSALVPFPPSTPAAPAVSGSEAA